MNTGDIKTLQELVDDRSWEGVFHFQFLTGSQTWFYVEDFGADKIAVWFEEPETGRQRSRFMKRSAKIKLINK